MYPLPKYNIVKLGPKSCLTFQTKKKIVKWTNPFTRHYEQNCFWRQEGNFLSAVVVRSWTIILSTQQHNNSFARHTIRKVDWCGLWVQMSLRLVSNWIAATKSRSIDRLTVYEEYLLYILWLMIIGKYRKYIICLRLLKVLFVTSTINYQVEMCKPK